MNPDRQTKCVACGFDPYDMIVYAQKQQGKSVEDLSVEEYEEEAVFYVMDNHPDFCPERKPDAHKDRYDDKGLLMKAIKMLDNIGTIVEINDEQYETITHCRDELLFFGLGIGSTEWWIIADTMEDHWVNQWWKNNFTTKDRK